MITRNPYVIIIFCSRGMGNDALQMHQKSCSYLKINSDVSYLILIIKVHMAINKCFLFKTK